jgi:hypothetical protein
MPLFRCSFSFCFDFWCKDRKNFNNHQEKLGKITKYFWIFSKFVTFVVLGETKSSERDENEARGCGVVQYFEKKQNFRR